MAATSRSARPIANGPTRGRRQVLLSFEPLEARQLPSVVSW
jgi:hypothetical protein